MWHALPLLVTLVATAEVKGTPEPCGCTSDPLGDVARVATLAKGGLWVDAGSLSYNREELSAERRPQADATAAALAHIYGRARVGLGAEDMPAGAGKMKPPRQACNVRGMSLEAPRVETIDGVKIGVFGVVTPARVKPAAAGEPVAAAKKAVAELRKKGAAVVVALCGMDRTETRALIKAVPGIQFAVVGAEVGDGMAEPEASRGRWCRVDDGAGDLARYAVSYRSSAVSGRAARALRGRSSAQARRAKRRTSASRRCRRSWRSGRRIRRRTRRSWRRGRRSSTSSSASGARCKADRSRRRRRATGFRTSWRRCAHVIARDHEVADELRKLAQKIGRANVAAAKEQAAPPAEPGAPNYVGIAACAKCHKPAVEFWKKTVHA